MSTNRTPFATAPLAVIAPVFATGVVVADVCQQRVTLFVWTLVVAVSLLVGVVSERLRLGAVLLGVFALGGANLALRNIDKPIPHEKSVKATVEIASRGELTAWGQMRADVRVVEWQDEEGATYRSNKYLKATYSADSLLPIGTRLRCRVRVRPMEQGRYAELMQARNVEGYARIDGCRVVGINKTLRGRAAEMQAVAVERLGRLGLDDRELTVAEAMTLGYRRGMSSALRESYADTGASHLLAVSGLHVGIVFVLVNMLLWMLPAINYGHIAKNVLAVVLIWMFAFVSGLSPSAVRAAVMSSFVQMGFALSREQNSLNTLCGAALLMLMINPKYVFDISFQLSFAAVLGIVLWFPVLFGWLRSESRLLNGVWSAVIVGVCATLAVLPLTAYAFGRVSVIGILLSPLVVTLAHVTVLCGLLWCIVPWQAMSGVISGVLSMSVGWQNDIVTATSRLPFSSVEWNPSREVVILIYLILLALSVIMWRCAAKNPPKITF